MVTTGSEVAKGLIQDAFTPVLVEKMAEYGCEMAAHTVCGDDSEQITAAIRKMADDGM